MPDPTFLFGGPSELPSASLCSADGLVRAVRSGPTLKATHRNLVTVPICLGLRGFPGHSFSVLKPGTSWANWSGQSRDTAARKTGQGVPP